MAQERFMIETADGEVAIPRSELISLEVELDTELAAMFRLRLGMSQQRDGRWKYLDETRFQIWKPCTIAAGFDTRTEPLLSGYITHVKPTFDADLAQCTLDIWGMDSSVLLDREEKLRAWPNEKDSSVATQIFSEYGLSSIVADTQVVRDADVSTIIQRETDMQFLKRLALRNGFECYLEGTTGFFRSPRLDAEPQPVLAVHFGAETNVNRLALEVNALTPTNIAMFQVDRTNKEILDVAIETSQQQILGAADAKALLGTGVPPGQVYVSMNVTTGTVEMTTIGQELFHQAEWFVTAEGEIDGNRYAHILKPHGTVTMKGVGETYSGVYYVTHVTHTFTPQGYTQFFRMKRNALRPTGREDFAGTAARLERLL